MKTRSRPQAPELLEEPRHSDTNPLNSPQVEETSRQAEIGREKWSTVGGLLSAFFSSICCIGPLIFSALGVVAGATGFLGRSARFAASIAPYRPFFVGLTFVFLGLGFYSVYKKEKVCDVTSGCAPNQLKMTKALLWVITGIALILVLSPYLLAIGS